jgi:hypothetical protein
VRRLLRLLASRTTAIVVMLAMAGLLALSSLVPEVELAPGRRDALRRRRPVAVFLVERLRPERVVRSPAFLALAAWIFAATAWSVVTRVGAEVRRRRLRPAPRPERFRVARALEVGGSPEATALAVREELRRRRYRLEPVGGDPATVVATRGSAGFAGSIAFHVGILVVMVGVALSARTRVNGEVMLVEGFPAALGPGTVARATREDALLPLVGTIASVRDFTATYERGFQPVDFAAVVDLRRTPAPPRAEVVRVNEGVTTDGFQLTLHRYGFAPELEVTGADGRRLADGVAILRLVPPGTEDRLALADGTELSLALYPDHVERGGITATRSMYPVAPVLAVRHLVGGAEMARGRVGRGEAAVIGAVRVSFPSLRYWADFMLGRDAGLPWIAVGGALIALGLGVRFLVDPQVVRAAASPSGHGTRLDLLVTARYFPALNAERARALLERLAGTLHAGGGGRA